jgi:hypothetical protein
MVGVKFPDYKPAQFDRNSPAYKAALARETDHQKATGLSEVAAQKAAQKIVNREAFENEKQRLQELVAPLGRALDALDRPRGCWSYVATTTTTVDGQTTVEVGRFDASQPEEKLWTLLTRNGQPPDADAQAGYRRKQLAAWHRQQRPKRRSASESVRLDALLDDMVITPSTSDGTVTYYLKSGEFYATLSIDFPSMEYTYVMKDDRIVQVTSTIAQPATVLASAFKLHHADDVTHYVQIEPDLPPFVARKIRHYHQRILLSDSGEVEEETVYSDYRRVTCYDDRFTVEIGDPTKSEPLPDQP